eukprot:COSAG03_NODE_3620_length_1918_cov_162.482133_3_plen_170_part_00
MIVPRAAHQVSMAAAEAAAEAAVARAAAQDGLPNAATEAFEPPLLLLPFRASELPPEVKQRTDALVESNMRAIYDASGWSEENEAPEGANGEVLYLLLFQHPATHREAQGDTQRETQRVESDAGREGATHTEIETQREDEDATHMAALADAIVGFVAAEFSVESGKASL